MGLMHTLEDKIVLDVIAAASKADTDYYLSGGMTVQMHLPRKYHRPTRDVDLVLPYPAAYSDYKRVMTPVAEELRENGYDVTFKKSHETMLLIAERGEEAVLLQTRRASPQNFAKHQATVDREYHNAVMYTVACTPTKIIRPEDLIIRKLGRVFKYEEIYGLQPRPWSYNFKKHLEAIKTFRAPLLASLDNVGAEAYTAQVKQIIATIKQQSDIFDIRALVAEGAVNDWYMQESLERAGFLGCMRPKVRKIMHGTGSEVLDDEFFAVSR